MNSRKNIVAAITLMAVTLISLVAIGCVTPRHIDELKAEIRQVETQTQATQDAMANMEAIIVTGSESNNKLRNDVTISMDNIRAQLDAMEENYQTILELINRIAQKPDVVKVIGSVPGDDDLEISTPPEQPRNVEPTIDCDFAYDSAFVVTLRQDYENAIPLWDTFLEGCASHENSSNAYYWYGECYYSLKKYSEAIEKFEFLANNYKDSPKAGAALYKVARSNEELGKKADAKKVYQKVVDDYPGSLEAKNSKERLKDLN